jgi:hypothetical protein
MIYETEQFEIEVKDFISYGEKEDIELKLFGDKEKVKTEEISGKEMFAFKDEFLKVYIKSIKNKETGEEVPYSKDWFRTLKESDGDAIIDLIPVFKKKD